MIATGQLLGEGADFDNLECLILAYPFAFEGKLIQYIGRVQRNEVVPIVYDYRDIHIDYLDKQFKQRNRYYRSLLNTGQLNRFDEILLIFEGTNVLLNSPDCVLSINCLDLWLEIEKFKEGVIWRVRVLEYDEEACELKTEIIDYHASAKTSSGKQQSLQFLLIDKISFRAIDTGQFLSSVDLKTMPLVSHNISESVIQYENKSTTELPLKNPIERTLKKTIKVLFNNLQFQYAGVVFPVYIEDILKEIKFEIYNPDIRPEFEAIKEYFIKILKKKLITVEIKIRYTEKEIIEVTANSENVDRINSSIIDSVRFEFVKKEMLTFKGKLQNGTVLNTLDSLTGLENGIAGKIFKSEQDLIDDMLNIRDSKHYLQLKYLSSQHLSAILKIRFILSPFSFLFLLSGDKQYHLVWETLNSEEATYIWHFEKSMDSLRKGLIEIEATLNEIKANSKQDYLRQEHDNFSRVIHDYSDTKSGFIAWKGMLEGKLV